MARHRWMFASGEQRNANQGYSTQLSIQRRQHAELSITTQKRLRYQQHSTHRRGRNHGRGDSRRGRRGRTHRQLTKLNRKLVERGIFAIFDKSCWIFASGEQGNANDGAQNTTQACSTDISIHPGVQQTCLRYKQHRTHRR